MTDRRDAASYPSPPPARPTGDGSRRADPLLRLVGSSRSGRRLSAAVAAGIVLVLAGWLALRAIHSATAWLHARPEFTISFDRIDLDPPPPDVYRGGRAGILARVGERIKLEEPIHILDQDLDSLGRAFTKYSPWVAACTRVERAYPDRLTVRLVYRKPVARMEMGRKEFFAIADDGVVLPGDEIVPTVASKLVRIEGFPEPPEARPGYFLGADDRGAIKPLIASAVRLAAWLSQTDEPNRSRIAVINLAHGRGKIMVKTRASLWVYWGNAPGEENDDEPGAKNKLERLLRWEDARGGEPVPKGAYLEFRGDSVRLHTPDGAWRREEPGGARPVVMGG